MTERSEELRVASDSLLRDLDALAQLEAAKRQLDPDDAQIVTLSGRIEALAVRVLEATAVQRKLTSEIHRDTEAGGDAPPIAETPRTLSAVLDAWRAAERRLASSPPGSPERAVLQREVETLREEYREAFEARGHRPEG